MSLCMSVTLSAPTFQKSEAMSWRAQGLSKNIIAKGSGVLGTKEDENTAEVTAKAGSTSAGPLDREERQKRPQRTGHLSRVQLWMGPWKEEHLYGSCHLSEIHQGSISLLAKTCLVRC